MFIYRARLPDEPVRSFQCCRRVCSSSWRAGAILCTSRAGRREKFRQSPRSGSFRAFPHVLWTVREFVGSMWRFVSSGTSYEDNTYVNLENLPAQKIEKIPNRKGISCEDNTYASLQNIQAQKIENNPNQKGCYQRSKVPIALCFGGLMLILALCVLGIMLPKYSAMKTEMEYLKEEQKILASLGSFLVYNEDHEKCAEVRSSNSPFLFELTASACSPDSYSQFFRWLPRGRLMSTKEGLCVGAERQSTHEILRLYDCDNKRVLNWVCTNESLLGIEGESLYFNFGNNQENVIMLYWGTGVWSRWKARSLEGKLLNGGACVH